MAAQDTPTKVLFLITKANWGGAQKYVYDLVVNLPRDRFDVAVVLGGTGELEARLQKSGVRTRSISAMKRDVGVLDEVRTITSLIRILCDERPDVLHLNSSKAGVLGAVIGRICGVPRIIFTAHGWAFNEDRPWWQKRIITVLHWVTLACAHVTIAVSETTKRQAPDFLKTRKRIVVIHNGVSPVKYVPRTVARAALATREPRLKAQLDQTPNLRLIGTIAELHPIKGHLDAITAYATVRDSAPPSAFVILGEGEMRARLETHIKNLALEQCVFLLGHMPDAATYLQAFDVFVLASHSEALSLAILEAGLAGVPVIATNVGGIPEIITQETEGILVLPHNTRALGDAIDHMLKDDTQRILLGRNLQERIRDEFTLADMVSKTAACYTPKNSLSASSRGTTRA